MLLLAFRPKRGELGVHSKQSSTNGFEWPWPEALQYKRKSPSRSNLGQWVVRPPASPMTMSERFSKKLKAPVTGETARRQYSALCV
jgi:hypothetical protein